MTIQVEGATLYVKAVGRSYSVSRDGASHWAMPRDLANSFFSLLQSDVTKFGEHLAAVRDVGSRTAHGIKVARYQATIPGRVISQAAGTLLSSLGKNTSGLSAGPISVTIDVNRATGFPVQIHEIARASVNLASLHRPGVSGVLDVGITSTRTFSHFRPHSIRTSATS